MASGSAIRINTPNVVGEEFDSEVVVVNLDSGYYFSILGSAKDIWRTLVNGSEGCRFDSGRAHYIND